MYSSALSAAVLFITSCSETLEGGTVAQKEAVLKWITSTDFNTMDCSDNGDVAILYRQNGNTPNIEVIDIKTGGKTLYRASRPVLSAAISPNGSKIAVFDGVEVVVERRSDGVVEYTGIVPEGYDPVLMDWSTDSEFFIVQRSNEGEIDIFSVNTNVTDAPEHVAYAPWNSNSSELRCEWLPSAKKLMYTDRSLIDPRTKQILISNETASDMSVSANGQFWYATEGMGAKVLNAKGDIEGWFVYAITSDATVAYSTDEFTEAGSVRTDPHGPYVTLELSNYDYYANCVFDSRDGALVAVIPSNGPQDISYLYDVVCDPHNENSVMVLSDGSLIAWDLK